MGEATGPETQAEDQRVVPWSGNIEQLTMQNSTFRTVLFTGDHAQLTVMNLQRGDDIGLEMHADVDQFIRIEGGEARVELGEVPNEVGTEITLGPDDAVMIPAGTWHNVTNVGDGPLRLYSIYSPPEHPADTVHRTKDDAIVAEEHAHGLSGS